MIKAVAFDPGKTTGFATGEIAEIHMLVSSAQAQLSHTELFDFLTKYEPDYIICERFDFRMEARTGLELISRELIGVINLYTDQNERCTLVMQTPAQAKGFWTDKKLLANHLYRRGHDHANDAMRHLMYWYKFGSGHQYGTEFKHKND